MSILKKVYPGQKVDFKVLVTDYKQQPVKNTNLTAYALKSAFDADMPDLPMFPHKSKKQKQFGNMFYLSNYYTSQSVLDYEKWHKAFHLDTSEYYKFLYTKDFYYNYIKIDNDETEIAPYIVNNGKIEPISYILCNRQPLYFSWTTGNAYSFKVPYYKNDSVTSAKNFYYFRLQDKYIQVNNLPVKKGYKLIISINANTNKITSYDLKNKYQKQELYLFDQYTMPYSVPNYEFSYLKNNFNYFILENGYYYSNMVGPIFSGNVTQITDRKFEHNFDYEPNWYYIFEDDKIKMQRDNITQYFPKSTSSYQSLKFSDTTLDVNSINSMLKQRNYNERITKFSNYNYSQFFRLSFTGELNKKLLNIFIINNERIYGYNNATTISDNFWEGFYNVVLMYEDGYYQIYDSLVFNEMNFCLYNFNLKKDFKIDSNSIKFDSLLNNLSSNSYLDNIYVQYYELMQNFVTDFTKKSMLERTVSDFTNDTLEANIIFKNLKTKFNGKVSGYVFDEKGTELPNVLVSIEGKQIQALTDTNGHYSISYIGDTTNLNLVFSYVGMQTVKAKLNASEISVILKQNDIELSDIIIRGITAQNDLKKTGYDPMIFQAAYDTLNISAISVNSSQKVVMHEVLDFGNTGAYDYNEVISGGVDFGNAATDINPNDILKIDFIDGSVATAIYDNRAANGVYIAQLVDGSSLPLWGYQPPQAIREPEDDVLMQSSLRTNFSDNAFWQPYLITNNSGYVTFSATFPDDITKWEANFIAVNKKLTGSYTTEIKSYKPIMGQIAAPKFILRGDTIKSIAKIANYTQDTLNLSSKFFLNDVLLWQKDKIVGFSDIDTLLLTAPENADSLKVKFLIEKNDGYFDGEERDIDILPVGVEIAEGKFYVLDKDTSITIYANDYSNDVEFSAFANEIDVILNETQNICNYKYYCNEQLASKLISYLTDKVIYDFKDEKFKGDKQIKKIIKLLEKNVNDDGLWGWWNKSNTSWWISMRVIEALLIAEQAGYETNINFTNISNKLIWKIDDASARNKIRILKVLQMLNISNFSYAQYANIIDTAKLSFNERLLLYQIQQKADIEINLDSVWKYQKQTLFGNIYFSDNDGNNIFSVFTNDILNTVEAYKILRDANVSDDTLAKIRNYFFEMKFKSGYWRNTYEAAKIIETITPDFIANEKDIQPSTIKFSGNVNKTITEFPFNLNTNLNSDVTVSKTGTMPVYFSVFNRKFVTKPTTNSEYFEINTKFSDGDTLNAGEITTLTTHFTVKKQCEYVMLNIPIPAGCTYYEKPNSGINHREYHNDRLSVFYEKLYPGTYTVKIKLMPRYSGIYTLNPAKAELMYFPVFYGNNELKKIGIE